MTIKSTQLPLVVGLPGQSGSVGSSNGHHPLSPIPEPRTAERERLYAKYADRLSVNPDLTRSLVSFQANNNLPVYRWLKYKEGFSAELVRYCLAYRQRSTPVPGTLLDPFAGTGTALVTAAESGWEASGIELLPVGVAVMRARRAASVVDLAEYRCRLARLASFDLNKEVPDEFHFRHLRITRKAFTDETERAIAAYRQFLTTIADENVRYLFWFAAFAVLEDVSFTRKDGQYLRWDARSGRSLKSTFNKGPILDFRPALTEKLEQILADTESETSRGSWSDAAITEGSCLSELALLADGSVDLVITSPPYCNRYDYTRTYALELAFLGHTDESVKTQRQTLLSATVENKSKRVQLARQYAERNQSERFARILRVFSEQKALHEVLGILKEAQAAGKLNNSNIPNLVENYFLEMCVVVTELARLLAPGGQIFMINDNVQYFGEEVPVDLILSDFAEQAGLTVERIWVLPRGKGNSSQQMGVHGRNEIRKCVYIWSKPETSEKGNQS
jgi:Tfp pilus assembly protein PilZ